MEEEEGVDDREYGRLYYDDIPQEVVTMYRRRGQLVLVVEWERRPGDNFKPRLSEVFSDEFKLDNPLKLIEFYERQTRFKRKPMYAARSRI